jgi:hypothetical protein
MLVQILVDAPSEGERIERLHHVVDASGEAAALDVEIRPAGRQKDDRKALGARIPVQLLGHVESAEVGQHHVEEDDVEGSFPGALDSLGSGFRGNDREPAQLEVDRAEETHRRVVLDEQHP